MTDQADAVAQVQRHRDIPQRLDDDDVGVVAPDGAARPAQDGLLQGTRLRVENGKLHPRAAGFDVRTCRHGWLQGLPVPGSGLSRLTDARWQRTLADLV